MSYICRYGHAQPIEACLNLPKGYLNYIIYLGAI